MLSMVVLLSVIVAGRYSFAAGVELKPSGGDDTAAIQKAIDGVARDGGGVVQLSSGVFKVSHLDLRTNITLQGEGRGATVLRSATDAPVISIAGILGHPVFNVVVEDLGLTGRGIRSAKQDGIYLINAIRGVIIRNVEIDSMGSRGIYSGGNVYGLKIADSRIASNTFDWAVILDKTQWRTNAVRLDNVQIWASAGGVLINNGFNDVLTGVWMENDTGQYPDVEIRTSYACGITDSYIERNAPGQPIVQVSGSASTFVANNIISDNEKGLDLEDDSSTLTAVRGNRFTGRPNTVWKGQAGLIRSDKLSDIKANNLVIER